MVASAAEEEISLGVDVGGWPEDPGVFRGEGGRSDLECSRGRGRGSSVVGFVCQDEPASVQRGGRSDGGALDGG